MNQELLRVVENVARDRISTRSPSLSTLRKLWSPLSENISAHPKVKSSSISTGQRAGCRIQDKEPININQLGRISAQTARQVMVQKIKADDERVFIPNSPSEKVILSAVQ